jgi:hypothetical protein
MNAHVQVEGGKEAQNEDGLRDERQRRGKGRLGRRARSVHFRREPVQL